MLEGFSQRGSDSGHELTRTLRMGHRPCHAGASLGIMLSKSRFSFPDRDALRMAFWPKRGLAEPLETTGVCLSPEALAASRQAERVAVGGIDNYILTDDGPLWLDKS